MCVVNAYLYGAVLHKIFFSMHVWLLLLAYYLALGDARVEQKILENIWAKLQRTKILHSKGKSARKQWILEVTILKVEADFSRFYWILDTKKNNVVEAMDWLQTTTLDSEVRFIVPTKNKRQGGIPDEVKVRSFICFGGPWKHVWAPTKWIYGRSVWIAMCMTLIQCIFCWRLRFHVLTIPLLLFACKFRQWARLSNMSD